MARLKSKISTDYSVRVKLHDTGVIDVVVIDTATNAIALLNWHFIKDFATIASDKIFAPTESVKRTREVMPEIFISVQDEDKVAENVDASVDAKVVTEEEASIESEAEEVR